MDLPPTDSPSFLFTLLFIGILPICLVYLTVELPERGDYTICSNQTRLMDQFFNSGYIITVLPELLNNISIRDSLEDLCLANDGMVPNEKSVQEEIIKLRKQRCYKLDFLEDYTCAIINRIPNVMDIFLSNKAVVVNELTKPCARVQLQKGNIFFSSLIFYYLCWSFCFAINIDITRVYFAQCTPQHNENQTVSIQRSSHHKLL